MTGRRGRRRRWTARRLLAAIRAPVGRGLAPQVGPTRGLHAGTVHATPRACAWSAPVPRSPVSLPSPVHPSSSAIAVPAPTERRTAAPGRRTRAVLAAATIALAGGALGAVPASAGVARLVVEGNPYPRDAATVRIVTTDDGGTTRTLGPFRLDEAPGGILAAPDGRHAVLLPSDDDEATPVWIAPLDGRPPVRLALPPGVAAYEAFSQISWSEDGSEVVIGNALWADPATEAAGAPAPRPDQIRTTALRCAVATATCVELPAPGGYAVPLPGDGAVVGSSLLSLLPLDFLFEGASDEAQPDWESARSARGRLLTGVANDVRTSSFRIEGPEGTAARELDRRVGPASGGLPVASDAVSGPGGALLTRTTLRLRLQRRGGKVRLRPRETAPRFLAVAPDGRVTKRAVPELRLSRRDQRPINGPRGGVGTLRFRPAVGLPDGGWVGSGVDRATGLNSYAPATMDAAGAARLLRTGGRTATPRALVAAAVGLPRRRFASSGPLEIVGYERATRRLLVRVLWGRSEDGDGRSAVLRVRLDGCGRPQVVRGGADTAW